MTESEYTKIYSGNFIVVSRIKTELENIGIVPIIKDEGESQRLAGYGSIIQGYQEIFVNNAEAKKASDIVNKIKAEIEKAQP